MYPLIREFRLLFYAILGVIVPFGILLYFFPDRTGEYWAWVIPHPRSAILIGAAYIGAIAYYVLLLRQNDWKQTQNGMGGLIIFCVVLLIATMAHWNEFRGYFVTTLVWLIFYYVGPFMVPIAYRKQNQLRGTQPSSATTTDTLQLSLPWRGWLIMRGFLYLTLAVFWLAQAEILAAVWPWPIGVLELRVFTGQPAIVGWNAIIVLAGRYSWKNVRLGLLLGGAIGGVQLAGLMLSSSSYSGSGIGLFLPAMFAEWLVTPLLLFLKYGWKGAAAAAPERTTESLREGSFFQFGARLLGTVYTVLGIAGFLPIHFLNPMHHEGVGVRYLFNLVAINTVHNLIHLAIGVTGLLAAGQVARSRIWGRVCGCALLLVFLGGIAQAYMEGLPPDQLLLGLVPLNSPGHILHLVTGVIALYLGTTANQRNV